MPLYSSTAAELLMLSSVPNATRCGVPVKERSTIVAERVPSTTSLPSKVITSPAIDSPAARKVLASSVRAISTLGSNPSSPGTKRKA